MTTIITTITITYITEKCKYQSLSDISNILNSFT